MGVPESGQERVWFAREVTGLFVKAFTNLKLYPREHTYCVEALEAFTKRLKAYVRMHGALRIAVESGRLAVEEQTVYEAESRQENLAFRLYVDGLRELSILPGVDSSEAERLALVFTRVLTNPELDSTQQLWEEDFRAIEYVAIDSLAEAWETPDSFSAEHLRSVEEANRDVSRLAESLTERGLIGALTFELTDGAAELRRVEVEEANRAEVEAAQDEALAEFLAGAVTDAEEEPEPQGMREFREDVLSWGPDRLLEGVVSQSLWGLFEAAGELTPESVRWVTREALDMALKAHDLELVRRLVTRYVDAYQRSEEEQSRREAAGRLGEGVDVVEVRRAVDEAMEWLADLEQAERLLKLGLGDAVGGARGLARLTRLLGPAGPIVASRLLQEVGEGEAAEVAELVAPVLAGTAAEDPGLLERLVEPESPAVVCRAALDAIRAGGDEATRARLFGIARKHPDAEVEKYATHLWRTYTEDGRVATHVEGLSSSNRVKRLESLEALLDPPTQKAFEPLKGVISETGFLTRDEVEQERFIMAAAERGGAAAVRFLQAQSERKGGLLRRRAVAHVRALSERALAELRGRR